jgi:hypothetical protein
MEEVFVLSAVRTPIGKCGGGLAGRPPVHHLSADDIIVPADFARGLSR